MMFVTLACVVFDLRAGTVKGASAGHPELVLLGPGRPPRFVFSSSGAVAGVMPGSEVTDESMEFAPGETFLLYSDGVSEAFGPEQELFGDDRLLEQLTREPGKTAAETVASVRAAVRRHAAETPQSDDITIVAVRRLS
jgi:sigma-B regulation protein RsbU (phosphoserine phosphatase)